MPRVCQKPMNFTLLNKIKMIAEWLKNDENIFFGMRLQWCKNGDVSTWSRLQFFLEVRSGHVHLVPLYPPLNCIPCEWPQNDKRMIRIDFDGMTLQWWESDDVGCNKKWLFHQLYPPQNLVPCEWGPNDDRMMLEWCSPLIILFHKLYPLHNLVPYEWGQNDNRMTLEWFE